MGARSGEGLERTEHSRLKGLVEKVQMAVYWMAMEANARSTTDFHEHCMMDRQMHQKATALSVGGGAETQITGTNSRQVKVRD